MNLSVQNLSAQNKKDFAAIAQQSLFFDRQGLRAGCSTATRISCIHANARTCQPARTCPPTCRVPRFQRARQRAGCSTAARSSPTARTCQPARTCPSARTCPPTCRVPRFQRARQRAGCSTATRISCIHANARTCQPARTCPPTQRRAPARLRAPVSLRAPVRQRNGAPQPACAQGAPVSARTLGCAPSQPAHLSACAQGAPQHTCTLPSCSTRCYFRALRKTRSVFLGAFVNPYRIYIYIMVHL